LFIIHSLGKYIFNTLPDTGEYTGRTIESKMDLVPAVMKLIVLPEGQTSKHATTTEYGKSYLGGNRITAVHKG